MNSNPLSLKNKLPLSTLGLYEIKKKKKKGSVLEELSNPCGKKRYQESRWVSTDLPCVVLLRVVYLRHWASGASPVNVCTVHL